MPHVKPDRRFPHAWHAIVLGLLLLLLVLLVFSDNRSPLSPLETRLVGEWSANPSDPSELIRTYSSDRTFSTSNGQFVGVWRIKDGRVTLTYWQPFELPHEYNYAAVKHSIRRTRKETVSWKITFAEDDKQHFLNVPGEGRPDGQWFFRRVGDE
jgi:hypothetical protein